MTNVQKMARGWGVTNPKDCQGGMGDKFKKMAKGVWVTNSKPGTRGGVTNVYHQ